MAKLTGNIKKNNLPDHASSDVISEDLAGFFLNKILKIRDNLEMYELYTYQYLQVHFPMASFKEVDEMCVCERLSWNYRQNHVNKIIFQPKFLSPELAPSLNLIQKW